MATKQATARRAAAAKVRPDPSRTPPRVTANVGRPAKPVARVPELILELYSALYATGDRAKYNQLLTELAAALEPRTLIEWLLTAEFAAMTLDDVGFRRLLIQMLSPGELFEAEPNPDMAHQKLLRHIALISSGELAKLENPSPEKQNEIREQIAREVFAHNEKIERLAQKNAPELLRRKAVNNFSEKSDHVEKLFRMIHRTVKRRDEILARLEASRFARSSTAIPIEDAEFSDADPD